MKTINLLWKLSLAVICICSLVWIGSYFLGIDLPDALVRVLGVLDLICVGILVFASVKRKRSSQ